jgi:pimeloyl-ACP methyl ester carboxylesterase
LLDLDETFDGTFAFAPRVFQGHGARQHYIDEGDGAPVLLLHGEPSWSYLYREIIPILATDHRVIAPDLIGFGKSETPLDFDYSGVGQAHALEALVMALDLREVTFVLHDWGGPIGGMVALRHPDRVRRIVLLNSVLPMGTPAEAKHLAANAEEARYFQWMARLHREGLMEIVLGEFGTIIPAVMKGLQGVVRAIDETWIRAYGAPFPTAAECKGVIELPRSIVSGDHLKTPSPTREAVEAIRAKPAMMIYGMQDRALLPHHFIPVFEAAFPGAPVHRLAHAGHFLQEDAPETIALLIRQFSRG